mgnify:CR=1 FL=1
MIFFTKKKSSQFFFGLFFVTLIIAGHPISIDGAFNDWNTVPVAYEDGSNDYDEADFHILKITEDNNFIFIYLSFYSDEFLMQSWNDFHLYIDADDDLKFEIDLKKDVLSKQIIDYIDLNFNDEIIESGKTLAQNADIKASFINKSYNIDCFADDTGLEINSLNGEPGVYSARYAGDECSSEKNIEKVKVLKTQSTWFGVTYVEDKPFVESQIKELIQSGEYPVRLF